MFEYGPRNCHREASNEIVKEFQGRKTRLTDFSTGQYCIYKYQTCPDGLTEGFILWDDHDILNKNDKGGTLPNGSYDHNTKIEFCCRTDGDKSHPILLPTRAPFYLLAYGSEQCQTVKWAIATQEWIYYDTENERNADQANGTYPYTGGEKDPTIYYCYYQGESDRI